MVAPELFLCAIPHSNNMQDLTTGNMIQIKFSSDYHQNLS